MEVLRFTPGWPRLSRAPLVAALLLFVSLPTMAQSVAIREPAAGAQYLPNQSFAVIAGAVAAGEDTVSNVEFFVDDKSIGMDREVPFESIGLSGNPGSHKLHAVLTTSRGTVVHSTPVTFETVRVVDLLAPLDGTHFRTGDAIPMQVTHRADGSGGFLQFFADNQLLREDTLPAAVAEVPTITYEWRDAPVGTHVLKAVVLSAKRELIGESTLSTVTVEPTPLSLQLRAPANPLPVKQGTPMTVEVAVASGLDEVLAPVGDVALEWVINGSGFPDGDQPTATARASAVAACDTPDAPSSGQVTTNSEGLADITFTPGCNGNRSLWVRVLGRPDIAPVQLPFAQEVPTATALRALLDGATYVIAEPGKAAALRVQAVDADGVAVADAITDWTLTPSDAGTLTAIVNTAADGVASGSVTLSGQRSASARICVRDQPGSCIDIQIRSTAELIVRPVQQIVAPIAQQAIETSRTQLGLLRSRMGQLRNEQGHGFCDGASVQVQGLSMPMCGGGGGGGDNSDGSRLGSFVMGNATLGKRDADGRWSGYELLTRGLTGGVDYRFSPEWVGGAALGIARGSVDVANINTQDSSGVSGSLFGQWMPSNGLFATGVLSVGRNSFDIERRGSDQLLLSSETDSRQTAMQLELGYSLGKQALKLTPYARYELVDVDVDSLTENGGPEAVAVDPYSLRNSALSAGLSADYAISSRSGVWIPSVNVEFHNETQNLDIVHARLVNGRYGTVNVPMPEDDNRYGTFGFNLQWLSGGAGQPISSFIGYGMVFGRDNVESKSFTLGVKLPF